MIQLIGSAILAGIVLSFGFGSVFFALVQTSIEYGFKNAVKIALGVCFGDFLLIGIAILGATILPSSDVFSAWARGIGAILLLILGIIQFRNKKVSTKIQEYRWLKFLYFFIKGFLLNVLNPVNLISWLVLAASLKSYRYNTSEQTYFLIITVLTIFICESLIALFASKIKIYLSESIIHKISIVTGLVFIGLSIKFVYDLIFQYLL
jgi:L-lysine exporter family protein LysE/ArgO